MEELPLFGQWVRTLCILLGNVSQRELARYAGVDRSTVTKIVDPEEGRKGPNAETIRKLWHGFVLLAEERSFTLALGMESAFFNAVDGTGITDEQRRVSKSWLLMLQERAALLERVEELERQIASLEAQVRLLHKR